MDACLRLCLSSSCRSTSLLEEPIHRAVIAAAVNDDLVPPYDHTCPDLLGQFLDAAADGDAFNGDVGNFHMKISLA